jgi:hypothetical protein
MIAPSRKIFGSHRGPCERWRAVPPPRRRDTTHPEQGRALDVVRLLSSRAMASSWRQISALSATRRRHDRGARRAAARRGRDPEEIRGRRGAEHGSQSAAAIGSTRGAPMYVLTPVTSPSRRVITERAGPKKQFAFEWPCPRIDGYTVISLPNAARRHRRHRHPGGRRTSSCTLPSFTASRGLPATGPRGAVRRRSAASTTPTNRERRAHRTRPTWR